MYKMCPLIAFIQIDKIEVGKKTWSETFKHYYFVNFLFYLRIETKNFGINQS